MRREIRGVTYGARGTGARCEAIGPGFAPRPRGVRAGTRTSRLPPGRVPHALSASASATPPHANPGPQKHRPAPRSAPRDGRIPHHFPTPRGRPAHASAATRPAPPEHVAGARVRMRLVGGRNSTARDERGQGGVRFHIAHSPARPAPPSRPLHAGPCPNAPPPGATEKTPPGSHSWTRTVPFPFRTKDALDHGRTARPSRRARADAWTRRATPAPPRAIDLRRAHTPPPPADPPTKTPGQMGREATAAPSRPGAQDTYARRGMPTGALDPPPPATPEAQGCWWGQRRGPRSFTHTREKESVCVRFEAESVLHLFSDVTSMLIRFRLLSLSATWPRNFCRGHVAETCVKGMQSTGTGRGRAAHNTSPSNVNSAASGQRWQKMAQEPMVNHTRSWGATTGEAGPFRTGPLPMHHLPGPPMAGVSRRRLADARIRQQPAVPTTQGRRQALRGERGEAPDSRDGDGPHRPARTVAAHRPPGLDRRHREPRVRRAWASATSARPSSSRSCRGSAARWAPWCRPRSSASPRSCTSVTRSRRRTGFRRSARATAFRRSPSPSPSRAGMSWGWRRARSAMATTTYFRAAKSSWAIAMSAIFTG